MIFLSEAEPAPTFERFGRPRPSPEMRIPWLPWRADGAGRIIGFSPNLIQDDDESFVPIADSVAVGLVGPQALNRNILQMVA